MLHKLLRQSQISMLILHLVGPSACFTPHLPVAAEMFLNVEDLGND